MDPKPRICISLDRNWLHRLGGDWFTYRRLIRRAGGVPFTVHDRSKEVRPFDGLLLGGGTDVHVSAYTADGWQELKRRDEFELQLIRRCIDEQLPIFGICRGCQLLNVAFGGTLKPLDSLVLHRGVRRCLKHPIVIRRRSLIYEVLRTRRIDGVRSLHREAVDVPGEGVRVVARGPDGTAEAIECEQAAWCMGVQWHPELIPWGNPDQELMVAFVRACSASHEREDARLTGIR